MLLLHVLCTTRLLPSYALLHSEYVEEFNFPVNSHIKMTSNHSIFDSKYIFNQIDYSISSNSYHRYCHEFQFIFAYLALKILISIYKECTYSVSYSNVAHNCCISATTTYFIHDKKNLSFEVISGWF